MDEGTVVHLWPPFFPVGCWRYDDSSKILVEVEKGETKFYVPIRERAVQGIKNPFFFKKRREKSMRKIVKRTREEKTKIQLN